VFCSIRRIFEDSQSHYCDSVKPLQSQPGDSFGISLAISSNNNYLQVAYFLFSLYYVTIKNVIYALIIIILYSKSQASQYRSSSKS